MKLNRLLTQSRWVVAGALGLAGLAACSSDAPRGSTSTTTAVPSTAAAVTTTTATTATPASTTTPAPTTTTAPSPRRIVEDFVQRVIIDSKFDAVATLVSPNLVRKPSTDDGAAGLEKTLRAQPPKGVTVHTVVSEGERVGVLFSRPDASMPSGVFEGLDLYTVRDGVIVEQLELGSTANTAAADALPPTTTRSPAKAPPATLDANRKLVAEFYQEVFGKGDPMAVDRLVAEGYLQHNPGVAPGRAGLRALITSVGPTSLGGLGSGGAFAEGEFVINVSELPIAPEFFLVDLFRIDGGVLVEHWDFTPIGTTLGLPGSPPPTA
jgi:predicted SnoaL-like aldol condensation-catalyzing enzyme